MTLQGDLARTITMPRHRKLIQVAEFSLHRGIQMPHNEALESIKSKHVIELGML
jgi:hypothetical protein